MKDFAEPLLQALGQWVVRSPDHRPVVALTAPVGAGKSTLARQLQDLAATSGLRLAVASIDDAYRRWPERQRRLAGNPFGVNRVPPGSHDPELLLQAIAHWRAGGELRLPRFDKTLRQGQGDRSGCSQQQADALLLEGWLVGYEPMGAAAVAAWLATGAVVAPGLAPLSSSEQAWLPRWDRALVDYQPLWACCDSFWVLQPRHWSAVNRWRLQAEASQRRRSGQGLDAAAINNLVRATVASIPPGLYQPNLIARAAAVATLGGRRQCLDVQPQASLSSSLIG